MEYQPVKPSSLVLRQYASERKVASIRLYHRFAARVKFRKNWCHCELSLRLLECLLLLSSLVKIL